MNTDTEIIFARDIYGKKHVFDKSKSLHENVWRISRTLLLTGSYLDITKLYLNYSVLSPYVASKYIPKTTIDSVQAFCVVHLEGGFVVPKSEYMDGENATSNFKHLFYIFRIDDSFPLEYYSQFFKSVITETVDFYVYCKVFCDKRMPNYVNFPADMMTICSKEYHGLLNVSLFFRTEYFCRLFQRENFPFGHHEYTKFCIENNVRYIIMHHLPITDIHPKVMYYVHFQNGMEFEDFKNEYLMYSGAWDTLSGTDINMRHHFHTFRSFKRLFYALKFRTKLRAWAYRAIDRVAREKYSPVKLQELVEGVRDAPDPEEALQSLLETW